jgi:hypothetical protein
MISAVPLSETAPLLEPLLTPLLEERGGFAAFAFGFGVTLFTAVAAGAGFAAKAICSASLLTGIFGKFKVHVDRV